MDFIKKINKRGFQAILANSILIGIFSVFLKIELINDVVYATLVIISIFVGCIIYFREKISKLTLNPKEGSLELELEEFKEDIVNNLIIKQNLLEIASGRYDGPPKKLKEILNLLGEEAYKKGEKYSSAMPYTEKIVEAYNEIDSIGSLKPAASDYDEKQKEMEQSHEKLETAFDDFLNYLKNKE